MQKAESTPGDPSVALCLGSAFLGYYAHAGFLNGLNEKGIFPGKVAGSSAGALAGGLYASGLSGDSLFQAIVDSRLKKSFFDFGFLYRWFPMLLCGHVGGLFSGQRLIRHLEKILPVSRIEDCRTADLGIAVTNLKDKVAPILSKGSVAEAIAASCAIPLLFKGHTIDGHLCFDGGIMHENPIAHFLQDPSVETIIIHHVTYPTSNQNKRFCIHDLFTSGHSLFAEAIADYRIKEAQQAGKKVITLETNHEHPGLFQSKSKKEQFYEAGYQTGLHQLPALDLEIKPRFASAATD